MATNSSPLISTSELKEVIQNPNVVIIDARSGPDAFERYKAGHPDRARHVDLDRDLSQKTADASKGGRHPLPDIRTFAQLLGKLGITPSSPVVVYDDKSGANAAARLWWMLRACGHENVSVVDGGLSAIKKADIKMTSDVPETATAPPYPVTEWKLPTASIEKVAAAVDDPEYVVIDVREGYRYRGESEPIDLTAGHIPGAVNLPYTSNLDENGKFLSAQQLYKQFQDTIGDRTADHVIVHCGSGVTACHTLLAMEAAGIKEAQLYVGSWSEWSRTGRPIASGEKT